MTSVGLYGFRRKISANYFPGELFFFNASLCGGGGLFENRSYTGGEVIFSMLSFHL